MKRIAILGSTGSIGCSALDVVDAHRDRLVVIGLAAGRNHEALASQIARVKPRIVSMQSATALERLRRTIASDAAAPVEQWTCGPPGLIDVATHPDVDLVLCASSGTAALEAVLAAIACGKTIALANKEVLVMAGALVMEAARKHGVAVLPVDSEHNAIHQCLHQRRPEEVTRLILTASGGPFRRLSAEALDRVTPAEALSHPTWKMGRKITIDSATLMNKGLEVIEAHWLFGVAADRIDVVIHPQSVVHSMAELRDGSVIAQLGITDMRLPIQYAFSWPERWDAPLARLDLVRQRTLEFFEPDLTRFPCLALAYQALRAERTFPVVLNAANEAAVEAFLDGRLRFGSIAAVIDRALEAHDRQRPGPPTDIARVREVDLWAREFSASTIASLASRESGIPSPGER